MFQLKRKELYYQTIYKYNNDKIYITDMKFDKRNPFAAWGHEQEIYTIGGEDGTIKFEEKGFTSLVDTTKDSLFVDDAKHPETAGKFTANAHEVFRTNNENSVDTLYSAKRQVEGKDVVREMSNNYNDSELKYNGINTPVAESTEEEANAKEKESTVGETEPTSTDNDHYAEPQE